MNEKEEFIKKISLELKNLIFENSSQISLNKELIDNLSLFFFFYLLNF